MIKKRALFLLIVYIVLTIATFEYILVKGRTFTITSNLPNPVSSIDDISIQIEQDNNAINVLDKKIVDGKVKVTVVGKEVGDADVIIAQDDYLNFNRLIVHKSGIITAGNFFGNTNGSNVIVYSTIAFYVCVIGVLIFAYKQSVKETLFRYKNITYIALIIFMSFLLINQFFILIDYKGLINSINEILSAGTTFSTYMFPIAFITSILIVISNCVLIKKEGFTLKNLVGAILGSFFCIATIMPEIIYQYSYSEALIEIHNEGSIAYHVYYFFTSLLLSFITYFECVLIATIILSVKAARSIPKCDKDYIMVLGCQIKKDGTLTNLLKSRVDRAIFFKDLQKEKSGKSIKLVVSGGKGNSEIISEAQAMKNYLLENGIDEKDIIVEDRSTNTIENFKYSDELILKENENPKIAFSTTNYHVFRAGITATSNNMLVEGIGSKTKSYFWINAFFREFIATLYYERIRHIVTLSFIALTAFSMIYMVYLSNTI